MSLTKIQVACKLVKKEFEAEFVVKKPDDTAAVGALVTVGSKTGTTDSAGTVTLRTFDAGTYAYTVDLAGYDRLTGSFVAA